MTGRLSLTQGMCVQVVDDGAAAAAALEAQRWGEAKRAALAEAQAVGEAALQQAASALVGSSRCIVGFLSEGRIAQCSHEIRPSRLSRMSFCTPSI